MPFYSFAGPNLIMHDVYDLIAFRSRGAKNMTLIDPARNANALFSCVLFLGTSFQQQSKVLKNPGALLFLVAY